MLTNARLAIMGIDPNSNVMTVLPVKSIPLLAHAIDFLVGSADPMMEVLTLHGGSAIRAVSNDTLRNLLPERPAGTWLADDAQERDALTAHQLCTQLEEFVGEVESETAGAGAPEVLKRLLGELKQRRAALNPPTADPGNAAGDSAANANPAPSQGATQAPQASAPSPAPASEPPARASIESGQAAATAAD